MLVLLTHFTIVPSQNHLSCELDDYFFDDDDVTPTEFFSANQGIEVKIKFEDDELVSLLNPFHFSFLNFSNN